MAAPEVRPEEEGGSGKARLIAIVAGIVAVVLLVAAGAAVWWLSRPENFESTRNIRDLFIIFLSLMSMLVVVALVMLITVTTWLVLMLKNEIKPLLVTINETLNTVRGTTVFMSENVVDPVVQVSSYAAGARRFVEVLSGLKPRGGKKS